MRNVRGDLCHGGPSVVQIKNAYQVHVDDLTEVRVHQLHDNVQVKKFLETFLRRERV